MDAAEARARLRVTEGADEAALYEARSKMIRYHHKTINRPEWNAPQCKLINNAFAVLFAELHAAASTAPASPGTQTQAVPGSEGARVDLPPVIKEEEEEEVIVISIDDPHDAHAGDPEVEADVRLFARPHVPELKPSRKQKSGVAKRTQAVARQQKRGKK